jgi:hypothetical protein
MAGLQRRPYNPGPALVLAEVLMRVVVVELPDRASAMLAVRAIRPVLTAAAGPWWLEQRGERWLIGGPVPTEWEDFVAETVSALGGHEVPDDRLSRRADDERLARRLRELP